KGGQFLLVDCFGSVDLGRGRIQQLPRCLKIPSNNTLLNAIVVELENVLTAVSGEVLADEVLGLLKTEEGKIEMDFTRLKPGAERDGVRTPLTRQAQDAEKVI